MRQQVRSYSHDYPLDIQMIKDRILLVLRLYDKINPEKVKMPSLTFISFKEIQCEDSKTNFCSFEAEL